MLNCSYLTENESPCEKQLHKHLTALSKINNITGFLPLDINAMLPVIKKEMEEIFASFECNFNLYNQEAKNSTSCCNSNNNQCKAFRDQLPIIVSSEQSGNCCRGLVCPGIYKSHVCVPLIAGTEIFGVISLKSKVEKKLSKDYLELLLAIANQVSATIQRAQLFNRLAIEKKNLEKANGEITQLNNELRKTINKLKKTQEQLIYSERLAAAGRLATNLTHEINNPAGIILSRLEWLILESRENGLPENVLQDLLVIKKHTERIAQVTRNLLTFSRPSDTNFTRVNLTELIRKTVHWLERQFSKKNIKLVLNLDSLPDVFGSMDQLEQVLVNLLTNARDALPQGGIITITTKHNQEQNTVQIDIGDTGLGIPEKYKDMIFDPFFSTKEKEFGTGLGLPISLSIIKEHGGSLTLESSPGQGSCFSIVLPCSTREKGGEIIEQKAQCSGDR